MKINPATLSEQELAREFIRAANKAALKHGMSMKKTKKKRAFFR